jgi:hypothetical protein
MALANKPPPSSRLYAPALAVFAIWAENTALDREDQNTKFKI